MRCDACGLLHMTLYVDAVKRLSCCKECLRPARPRAHTV